MLSTGRRGVLDLRRGAVPMRQILIAAICFLAAACGPRDARPDPEKLAGFRKDVAAIDHPVTAASDAYTLASNAALDRNDRAAFNAAAAALRTALAAIRPDAAKIKAPEFGNDSAREHAGQVLAAILAGIDANSDAAMEVGRMADPHHPSPAEISAIQDARDRVSAASVAESDNLFSLFSDLGVTPGPTP